MARRIKPKTMIPELMTRGEAETALGDLRSLVIEQGQIRLSIEAERKKLEERHESRIAEINSQIMLRSEQLRVWSEHNRREFGELKSLEMTHGVMGWRTGQPTLSLLPGWTWMKVLARLKSLRFRRFIRVKEEVDKATILARRRAIRAHVMERMGVAVSQDDAFFVEPKVDAHVVAAVEPGNGPEAADE